MEGHDSHLGNAPTEASTMMERLLAILSPAGSMAFSNAIQSAEKNYITIRNERIKKPRQEANEILERYLSDTVLATVREHMNNHDYAAAFRELNEFYMRSGNSSYTTIQNSVTACGMKTSESLEAFIARFQQLLRHLAAVTGMRQIEADGIWHSPSLEDIEANISNLSDFEIRELPRELILPEKNRIAYFFEAVERHPGKVYELPLREFRSRHGSQSNLKELYRLLYSYDTNEVKRQHTSSDGSIKQAMVAVNEAAKKCIYHPDSTSHSTDECRVKRGSGKQKLCTYCEKHHPNIANTHVLETCRAKARDTDKSKYSSKPAAAGGGGSDSNLQKKLKAAQEVSLNHVAKQEKEDESDD